jgi:hypothetical protein
MTQMTPKEALAKDGTVPVSMGKGRLSKAGIARCEQLAAEGWDIKGYVVSSSPATSTAPATREVKRVKTSSQEVVELAPLRYDEREWKAVSAKPIFGKTEFTLREVCTTCGVSLVGHVCDDPMILGGQRVTLVRV